MLWTLEASVDRGRSHQETAEAIGMSVAKEIKRSGSGGVIFVGCLMLGLGAGFFLGNVVAGLFGGLGVGLIALGIVRAATGSW
jgi:hypothetical protein